MVYDFKLTWTDSISMIVDPICKEGVILKLRSDASFFNKPEDKSSVVDLFARCSKNIDTFWRKTKKAAS